MYNIIEIYPLKVSTQYDYKNLYEQKKLKECHLDKNSVLTSK